MHLHSDIHCKSGCWLLRVGAIDPDLVCRIVHKYLPTHNGSLLLREHTARTRKYDVGVVSVNIANIYMIPYMPRRLARLDGDYLGGPPC